MAGVGAGQLLMSLVQFWDVHLPVLPYREPSPRQCAGLGAGRQPGEPADGAPNADCPEQGGGVTAALHLPANPHAGEHSPLCVVYMASQTKNLQYQKEENIKSGKTLHGCSGKSSADGPVLSMILDTLLGSRVPFVGLQLGLHEGDF